MNASLITISNILGVKDCELDLRNKRAVIIRGRNGSNKSSVIEAIRSIAKGGHDATLLRNGAEEGEIVFVMDDDTRARRRITEASSTLTVTDPVRGKISKGQGYIESIIDAVSIDPIAFITAQPNKRAEILLETIPLELSDEQRKALKKAGATTDELDARKHPLESLAAVRKRIFEIRTDTNRTVKEKLASISGLRESLPQGFGETNYEDEAIRIDGELQTLDSEREAAIGSAETACSEELARLQSEYNREFEEMKAKYVKLVDEAKVTRDTEKQRVEQETGPKHVALREQLAVIRAKAEDVGRARHIQQQIEQFEAQRLKSATYAEELTTSIETIDEIKAALLHELPAGLEVRDKTIYKDGIVFDRLNTAQRISLAVELMKYRVKARGTMPLILLDGAEALDTESLAILEQGMIDAGLLPIITVVEDCPFTIEYVEAEEAVAA
jgi:hypothetical protein